IEDGFSLSIELLNQFIRWVAKQDSFLFTEIPFSRAKLIALYVVIFAAVGLWKQKTKTAVFAALLSIILYLTVMQIDRKNYMYNELVLFHVNRTSLIGVKQGTALTVLTDDTVATANKYPLTPYRTATGIATTSVNELPSLFAFDGTDIMVIDSLGIYNTEIRQPIVLLIQSPKINLDRLIETLNPRMILADGSNYTSYVNRWSATCTKRKLPFHHTGTKGAFTLKIAETLN
ncbi:MAG: ComEC family competence protein, partial [Marinirhabdus sp.]|nr:ComEC family competence protein [Marinirhabdus sp.]